MTAQDLFTLFQDLVGYAGTQLRRLLILGGLVATGLLGEAESLGLTPVEHRCLIVVVILGGSLTALGARPYAKRDEAGNYPPQPQPPSPKE